MSEQERINLYDKLSEAMNRSTEKMLRFKEKLGENVVIADAGGNPIEVPAREALQIFNSLERK